MALVTRATTPSVETGSAQRAPQVLGIALSDIDAGAPCYIDGSTAKIAMCNATAANALAIPAGVAARSALAGEPVTLYGAGSIWHYSDADLTAGAILYIGATAGRLDTAATTGDAVGYAQVMPDKRTIRITRHV